MLLPLIQNLGFQGPADQVALDFQLRQRHRIDFDRSSQPRINLKVENKGRYRFEMATRKYPS